MITVRRLKYGAKILGKIRAGVKDIRKKNSKGAKFIQLTVVSRHFHGPKAYVHVEKEEINAG